MLSVDRQEVASKRAAGRGFTSPMLPTLVAVPPIGNQWIHEIKHDGYRTQIVIERDRRRAFTRNGHDWSHVYRTVLSEAAELGCRSVVLDGGMIVLDEQGRSDFDVFKVSLHRSPERPVFYAFDLLWLNGLDLRPAPLIDRRGRLFDLLGAGGRASRIQFSEHVIGGGEAFFRAAEQLGLEGIVSKRASSKYASGRSKAWVKTKAFTEGSYVVVGFERSAGRPTTALLARAEPEGLEYVGGAMLTLPEREREAFWALTQKLASDQPPVGVERRPGAQWVKPELKVRARHLGGGGQLRHATILRLER